MTTDLADEAAESYRSHGTRTMTIYSLYIYDRHVLSVSHALCRLTLSKALQLRILSGLAQDKTSKAC